MIRLAFKYSLLALVLIFVGQMLWYITMVRFYEPELLVSIASLLFLGLGIYISQFFKPFSVKGPNNNNELSALNPAYFTSKYQLTAAEIRILNQLLTGLSNAEIAEKAHVSTNTVKTHVGAILQKTGAKNRTQLVVLLTSPA